MAKNSIVDLLKKKMPDVNIYTGNNAYELENITGYIDTGNKMLNLILSGQIDGGIPLGRITEIFGREGTGKSTFAMQMAKTVLEQNGIVIYFDAENAFNMNYARQMGLLPCNDDIDEKCKNNKNINYENFILISAGVSLEKFLEIIDSAVDDFKSGKNDVPVLIVLDSIASILTESEIKDNNFNVKGFNTARALILSQKLPLITTKIASTKIGVFIINQVRDNPGVMFGSSETTTGGNALKFYATLRLKLIKRKTLTINKDGVKKSIGQQVEIVPVKNKLSVPLNITVDLIYGYGIQPISGWIEKLIQYNVIKKSGGWINISIVDKATGEIIEKKYREKELMKILKNDKELAKILLLQVKDKIEIDKNNIKEEYFPTEE